MTPARRIKRPLALAGGSGRRSWPDDQHLRSAWTRLFTGRWAAGFRAIPRLFTLAAPTISMNAITLRQCNGAVQLGQPPALARGSEPDSSPDGGQSGFALSRALRPFDEAEPSEARAFSTPRLLRTPTRSRPATTVPARCAAVRARMAAQPKPCVEPQRWCAYHADPELPSTRRSNARHEYPRGRSAVRSGTRAEPGPRRRVPRTSPRSRCPIASWRTECGAAADPVPWRNASAAARGGRIRGPGSAPAEPDPRESAQHTTGTDLDEPTRRRRRGWAPQDDTRSLSLTRANCAEIATGSTGSGRGCSGRLRGRCRRVFGPGR